MSKQIGEKRLENIIRHFLDGGECYTNISPRISTVERAEVEKRLGVLLQREHTWGAQTGPIAIYPLDPVVFKAKAEEYFRARARVKAVVNHAMDESKEEPRR